MNKVPVYICVCVERKKAREGKCKYSEMLNFEKLHICCTILKTFLKVKLIES